MKKTPIILLISSLLMGAALIVGTFTFMEPWGVVVKAICAGSGLIGAAASVAAFAMKKEAVLKTAFLLVVFVFAVFAIISLLNYTLDLASYDTDSAKMERIVKMIRDSGRWGKLVFVLLQVLQVVILPLPAVVCYVSGTQVWSPIETTVLASVGVLAGSAINYLIGRLFGRKVVEWIAGKETTDKYAGYLGKRGKGLFIVMQILPFFPDDILCLLAGLTKMNGWFFAGVMIFVRPLIIALYCFLGSGTVIPFSGWGIPVWIAIFAACVAFAVLSFRYQDRFEAFLARKFGKKGGEEDGE